MRKPHLAIIIILFAIFGVGGCGGGMLLNKHYTYDASRPGVRLAILPSAGDRAELTDSMFVLLFKDSTFSQDIIDPKMLRYRISNDRRLTEVLNKLGSVEYSKDQLQQGASILDDLSIDDFAYLRQQLGQPSLVLFPVALRIESQKWMTFGYAKMRLFDFNSGVLVYQRSQDLMVNVGGDDGEVWMAYGLIGLAKDDFRNHFWNKFILGD